MHKVALWTLARFLHRAIFANQLIVKHSESLLNLGDLDQVCAAGGTEGVLARQCDQEYSFLKTEATVANRMLLFCFFQNLD